MILDFHKPFHQQYADAAPLEQTILDLSYNHLGMRSGEQLVKAFVAIPANISTLNLSHNEFDTHHNTAPELATAFEAIPAHVNKLILDSNDLGSFTGDELAYLFTSIPASVTSLSLMNTELHRRSGAQLAIGFASIPAHITSIDLGCNYLGIRELAIALAAIPCHINKISLNKSTLARLPANELALIFAAIPNSITTLDLFDNQLGAYGSAELATVLAAIPASITTLNLDKNDLNKRSGIGLAKVFAAIPSSVTKLNLNCNDLGSLSTIELANAFSAIPIHITSISLYDDTLDKITEADWIKILNKLPASVSAISCSPITQEKISKVFTTIRKEAFDIINKTTSLFPDLTGIVMKYATNTTNFWTNKSSEMKEDKLSLDISMEEEGNLHSETAEIAYQKYKAACKTADKNKSFDAQVRLRILMALCLNSSKDKLKAKFHVLSAIRLILNSPGFEDKSIQLHYVLSDAIDVFNDINGFETPYITAPRSGYYGNILKYNSRWYAVNRELQRCIYELIPLTEHSMPLHSITQKEILQPIDKKLFQRITEIASRTRSGIMVDSALGLFGYKRTGVYMPSKNLEKITHILQRALTAYDKEKFQDFFNILSETYDTETGASLIKAHRPDPENLIDTLLSLGFRPDGIAYILTLFAEVLCFDKVKIAGRSDNDIFGRIALEYCVFNEKLAGASDELDKIISEFRKSGLLDWRGNLTETTCSASQTLQFKTDCAIAQKFLDESKQISFKSRLDELSNMAKINIAMKCAARHDPHENDKAFEVTESCLNEIRNTIAKESQPSSISNIRLDTAEELLYFIHGKNKINMEQAFANKKSIKEQKEEKIFDASPLNKIILR